MISRTDRRRTWWTRERVLEGLRRFHADTGLAPTATHEWHEATKGQPRDPTRRRYPSFYGVLRWYETFRQAWAAAGIHTNRDWEEWTPIEDWYLREGAGLLSRKELAADLNRTPDAVHRRLYDLGLHSYQVRWGWTLHHLERVAGVPRHLMDKYLERGEVAFLRGSKCIYVDPADLLVIDEIDWAAPPIELERDVRRALVGRLVNILAGQEPRAGSLFHRHRQRTTDRVYAWRLAKPTPRPTHVAAGDRVRCTTVVPGKERALGREGVVHTLFWRAQGSPAWVVRVEFKSQRAGPHRADRTTLTLPAESVQRARSTTRRWRFDGKTFTEVA